MLKKKRAIEILAAATILCAITALYFLYFNTAFFFTDNVRPFSVAFIKPDIITSDQNGSQFFNETEIIAKKACSDLGIELLQYTISAFMIDAQDKRALENFISRDEVNGIIIPGSGFLFDNILPICEYHGKPVIFINNIINISDRAGKPGKNYRQYIGHISHDDEEIGYQSGIYLFERLISKHGRKDIIPFTALCGNPGFIVTKRRLSGLKRALSNYPNIVLNQYFTTTWRKNGKALSYNSSISRNKVRYIINRYPDTRGFWCESDSIAAGLVEGLEENGIIPGVDVLITGIDYTSAGTALVDKGKILATFGGHIINGALGVVMMSDYLNNRNNTRRYFEEQSLILKYDGNTSLNLNKLLEKVDFNSYRLENYMSDSYDFAKKISGRLESR